MDEKITYSPAEAAKLLGVSRKHLYDLWRDGKGPFRRKSGSRVLIPRETLLQWAKTNGKTS